MSFFTEWNLKGLLGSVSNAVEPKNTTKPKAPKKVYAISPRFETRLSSDHQKIVTDAQAKAFKEAHSANKGINNSELFGGFLEFMRPLLKKVSFKNLNFPCGKLYGDGTKKIKVEIGQRIERAAFEYFLDELAKGDNQNIVEILSSLPAEKLQLLKNAFDNIKADYLEQRLAAGNEF